MYSFITLQVRCWSNTVCVSYQFFSLELLAPEEALTLGQLGDVHVCACVHVCVCVCVCVCVHVCVCVVLTSQRVYVANSVIDT